MFFPVKAPHWNVLMRKGVAPVRVENRDFLCIYLDDVHQCADCAWPRCDISLSTPRRGSVAQDAPLSQSIRFYELAKGDSLAFHDAAIKVQIKIRQRLFLGIRNSTEINGTLIGYLCCLTVKTLFIRNSLRDFFETSTKYKKVCELIEP